MCYFRDQLLKQLIRQIRVLTPATCDNRDRYMPFASPGRALSIKQTGRSLGIKNRGTASLASLRAANEEKRAF